MSNESPYDILQKILSVPRERLSWWNIAVASFARNFRMNAAAAAEILSPCWQQGEPGGEFGEEPEEILESILSLPRESLSWWNVIVLSFSKENHVNAATASHVLSTCWDQGMEVEVEEES